MKQAKKISEKVKRFVQPIKRAGLKMLAKASSKIKNIGKTIQATLKARKATLAQAKKKKAAATAAKKAKAYQALCKDKNFVSSKNTGYQDPTYNSKAGYPKPDEVWAFDANGNIDKKKSAELSKKLGDWSTVALMAVIPGPDEILLAGLLAKAGGKAVLKVTPKLASKIETLLSKLQKERSN
ncbi:hypothetical protein [Listeria cornellensis]|uniref:hypothetical protein n=1 Tax=Listeria cornellensis TaxID=1494961 RepID=UPI0004B8A06B|nr:hypothetical protein [Listeria cornellensis]